MQWLFEYNLITERFPNLRTITFYIGTHDITAKTGEQSKLILIPINTNTINELWQRNTDRDPDADGGDEEIYLSHAETMVADFNAYMKEFHEDDKNEDIHDMRIQIKLAFTAVNSRPLEPETYSIDQPENHPELYWLIPRKLRYRDVVFYTEQLPRNNDRQYFPALELTTYGPSI